MPKLFSSDEIMKALAKKGFIFISQNGSHAKLRKVGNPTLTVNVPADKREIPVGTFRSILRQSHSIESDFLF